ncbi:MAG: SMP-30/gluconolactonase/LRE family protein [Myxococcales bacterium]|nr:SMP-30/gluconolactonase/LRE family protein [Myxococcales bacterium]
MHTHALRLAPALLACVALACGGGAKDKAPEKKAPEVKAPEAPKEEPKPEPKPEPEEITLSDAGFLTPESVLHDVAADLYLVSNIDGDPTEADGNGFISQVAPDGTVRALKWIDGFNDGVTLNAPKGMAIVGDTLYVADITHVRAFDRNTGAPQRAIEVKGASFLNDLAVAPDGSVLVSDSGLKKTDKGLGLGDGQGIYRINAEGEVSKVIANKDLGGPNGLYADVHGVTVVTFGTGEYYQVAPDGTKGVTHKLEQGQLDGVVGLAGGKLAISSWEAKGVYVGTPGGEFTLTLTDLESPADIGYDSKRKRVLVPLFTKNTVVIRKLE